MYDVLKFLHIVAAIVWVGAGFWTGFFGARVAAFPFDLQKPGNAGQ